MRSTYVIDNYYRLMLIRLSKLHSKHLRLAQNGEPWMPLNVAIF